MIGDFKLELEAVIDQCDWDALATMGQAHQTAEIDRMLELSRLSGLDVVYDLSMFDVPWYPVYRAGDRDPVAWVSADGTERREGKDAPWLQGSAS